MPLVAGGLGGPTLEDVQNDEEVLAYLEMSDEYLGALGYTEHGLRHANLVAHIKTAKMFGVPVAGIDPLLRRNAKMINYGIIYGIAAALGFASVENVIYIVVYDSPGIGVARAFTATLGHVACTGMIGYFVMRSAMYAGLAGRRSDRNNAGLAMLAIGAGLAAIGFLGTFFGNMIKGVADKLPDMLVRESVKNDFAFSAGTYDFQVSQGSQLV